MGGLGRVVSDRFRKGRRAGTWEVRFGDVKTKRVPCCSSASGSLLPLGRVGEWAQWQRNQIFTG